MAEPDMFDRIDEIAEASGRYHSRAFHFVLRSIEYTRRRLGRTGHVTGGELLESARLLAIEEFGPSAKLTLNGWGIETTEDIGRIVFLMIDHELLSKTDEDTIEDFRQVFDFETEFVAKYRY